jgi:stringent starvation protein B
MSILKIVRAQHIDHHPIEATPHIATRILTQSLRTAIVPEELLILVQEEVIIILTVKAINHMLEKNNDSIKLATRFELNLVCLPNCNL